MPAHPRITEAANLWRRRARRGWALLGFAAAAAVGLLWLDQELKRPPHPGYVPEDATFTLVAAQLPGVLTALKNSHAGQALFAAWPAPVETAARTLRLTTGIRPTPRRCQLWLGETALAGMGPSGMGLCVRPGVAARAVHLVNRLWRGRESSGCYRYGIYYYDWHDGFLLISPEPGYVRAARTAPPQAWPGRLAFDEVHLAWKGDPPGSVLLGAATGLRITGSLAWHAPPRGKALTLGMAWPGDPIVMAAASTPGELAATVHLAWQKIAGAVQLAMPAWVEAAVARAQTIVAAWPWDQLGENWAARADEIAVAFYPGEPQWGPAEGAVAMAMRAPFSAAPPHPLNALLTPGEARRYEWSGVQGHVQPWLGHGAMLCLATDGPDWLAASHPGLMARLAGHMTQTSGVAADIVAEAHWAGLAAIAMRLAREAAQYELLPGMNARDVDDVLGPPLAFMAELGRLQVAGRARAGELRLRGHLALPGEAPR